MLKLAITDLPDIHSHIIYIVGINGICFIFLGDHKIKFMKESMKNIESVLCDKSFVRINYHVIVNSKFYVRNNVDGKKEIVMRNGTVLKVSRRKWTVFKQNK